MSIRRLAYRLLPGSWLGLAAAAFPKVYRSYAYIGEDLVAHRLLKDMIGLRPGVYVDVGAFHPKNVSNTQHLYAAGWRGLNVEADPHKLIAFRIFRPRDINVCAVIDADECEVEFFSHDGAKYASMAGLDKEGVSRTAEALGRSVSSRTVRTRALKSLLLEHRLHTVDFLNIDVEGSELGVLRSIDLDAYKIPLISIEVHGGNASQVFSSNAVTYLRARGYELAAWTPPTVFMRRGEQRRYGEEQSAADRLW